MPKLLLRKAISYNRISNIISLIAKKLKNKHQYFIKIFLKFSRIFLKFAFNLQEIFSKIYNFFKISRSFRKIFLKISIYLRKIGSIYHRDILKYLSMYKISQIFFKTYANSSKFYKNFSIITLEFAWNFPKTFNISNFPQILFIIFPKYCYNNPYKIH